MPRNPHLALMPLATGPAPRDASAAAILLHGRGQEAEWIVDALAGPVALDDVCWLAPRAAGGTWYPGRYGDPPEGNAGGLALALDTCDAAVAMLGEHGMPVERIVLAGFSQGACVVAELLARRGRPFAGAAILTGSLLGLGREVRPPSPSLEGVRVLVSSSTRDEWIDADDVLSTARLLADAGATVDVRLRADPGHGVHPTEVDGLRELLLAASRGEAAPGSL